MQIPITPGCLKMSTASFKYMFSFLVLGPIFAYQLQKSNVFSFFKTLFKAHREDHIPNHLERALDRFGADASKLFEKAFDRYSANTIALFESKFEAYRVRKSNEANALRAVGEALSRMDCVLQELSSDASTMREGLIKNSISLEAIIDRNLTVVDEALDGNLTVLEDALDRNSGILEEALDRHLTVIEDAVDRNSGILEDTFDRNSDILEEALDRN